VLLCLLVVDLQFIDEDLVKYFVLPQLMCVRILLMLSIYSIYIQYKVLVFVIFSLVF